MNDRLEQAVALLKEKQVSCVIWIEGKEPILSDEIGIKPLMKELRKERHAFEHGGSYGYFRWCKGSLRAGFK